MMSFSVKTTVVKIKTGFLGFFKKCAPLNKGMKVQVITCFLFIDLKKQKASSRLNCKQSAKNKYYIYLNTVPKYI